MGERGVVLYSDTGGNTWQQAVVPHSNTLTSVTFIDAQNGWAAGHGGIILHSGDGGQTWHKQFDGNQANRQWLNFIQQRRDSLAETIEELDDSQQAERDDLEYRLDDEYALEDAALALQTGPVDPFLDIWFGDAKNGVAVGAYGMIFRTEDAGENWVIAAAGIENPDRYHYYDVDADRSGRLYLSGEAGLMYRSLDGGRQWQRLGPFYDGSLFGVVTRARSNGLRRAAIFLKVWMAARVGISACCAFQSVWRYALGRWNGDFGRRWRRLSAWPRGRLRVKATPQSQQLLVGERRRQWPSRCSGYEWRGTPQGEASE